jgi:hypothetical protein
LGYSRGSATGLQLEQVGSQSRRTPLPVTKGSDADFYEINCRERKCNKRKQVGLTIDPDGLAAPLSAATST